MNREELRETLGINEMVEEQATGCAGVGTYRQYADSLGYSYVKVLDHTSSAGNWTFLVSKDSNVWQVMSQENNRPSPRFTYYLDEMEYVGTFEEVCELIESLYY